MASLQAQPSINDARAGAHLALIRRLGALDLTPLLVYRIDSVPAGALPLLGWQFDLVSPLWQLIAPLDPALSVSDAATAARRALIKAAIPLHRARGTPYALKTALASLGWAGAAILEGQASWGGASWPVSQGWAVCRLEVPLQALAPAPVPLWSASATYAQGAVVSYNGYYFWASGVPTPGTPPQAGAIDMLDYIDAIADWDNLVTAGWTMLSAPYRPVGPADAALIAAAFNFFKPARAWLDAVCFVAPDAPDAAPVPADRLAIGGSAIYAVEPAPVPSDALGTLSLSFMMAESYPPISPQCNAHYRCKGHNCGANQPLVDDGPLVLGGVIQGESQ